MKTRTALITLLLLALIVPLILTGCGNEPNYKATGIVVVVDGETYCLVELHLPPFIETTHDTITLSGKTYLIIPASHFRASDSKGYHPDKESLKGFNKKQGLRDNTKRDNTGKKHSKGLQDKRGLKSLGKHDRSLQEKQELRDLLGKRELKGLGKALKGQGLGCR